MSNILGLITARGGSKGIPQKNIRHIAGKPLIAWTIEAALSSQCFERVIVSTEDLKIGEVARKFGAEVPFIRPFELAQDNSLSIDAVLHAVHWLADYENCSPNYVMLLQPTSVLRSADDIQKAVQMIQDKHADSIVSVTPVHEHPYWTKAISPDGRLVDFLSLEESYSSRQDLPSVYALNGAIYLAKLDVLLAQSSFYGDNTLAYVMPPERSIDIDTPWDFYLAELILKDVLSCEND